MLDNKWVLTDNFVFKSDVGLGVLLGGFTYSKTDDTAQNYYTTYRYGMGLAYSIGADCLWLVEEDIHVGVGVSYFYGKIPELRRVAQTADSSMPELDFSGVSIKFTVGIYL